MKTILRTLLTTAVLTAAASAAFAESYEVTSIEGTTKLVVSVQGAGVAKIPSPALPLPAGGVVGQHFILKADNTVTGAITFIDHSTDPATVVDLFSLSGAWYRPPGSKVIYWALDGDPTKGAASDGAYGALFDPDKAALTGMSLQNFMPILFKTKISALSPIFPTVKMNTGIMKLKLNGNVITSATTDLNITGRAMVQYCKKSGDSCVNYGSPKDAAFGFKSSAKATVITGP